MDAFSDECRQTVIDEAKKWGTKFDLVVYSLASPVRVDPDTKVLYKSVIKPIGKPYGGYAIDMITDVFFLWLRHSSKPNRSNKER